MVNGTFACAQAAARAMVEQQQERSNDTGGRIVVVGSIMADQVQAGRGAYTSCKCAARQMAKTLALELAPYNITVNVVQPGHVVTRNNPSKRRPATIPLGRLGDPRDAAFMVAFLCSHAAQYCTGSVFNVDGGYTVGMVLPR